MSSSADKPSLNCVKKELEAKGMQQVKDLNLFGPQPVKDSEVEKNLTNILQSGFDEFKKETGREMTYSEMRELYG